MAKKMYEAVIAVDHDNERVEPGKSIELDDKHAKPLLGVGAIRMPAEADKAEKAKPK